MHYFILFILFNKEFSIHFTLNTKHKVEFRQFCSQLCKLDVMSCSIYLLRYLRDNTASREVISGADQALSTGIMSYEINFNFPWHV